MNKRVGFTLIELLVVIAIIAILSSILFPVFAQAKNSAKNAVSLSNIHQLGTAGVLYAADHDDYSFPAEEWDAAGQTVPDNLGAFRWPWLLLPYVKSMALFRSPLDTSNYVSQSQCEGGCRDTSNPFYGYLWGLFPSYGYNWFYLAPDYTWTPSEPPGNATSQNSRGLPLTEFNNPSSMVELVDSTWGDPDVPSNISLGYYTVNPPMMWTGNPPLTRSSYGFVWPRYNDHANTLFLDSHVKTVPIEQLDNMDLWTGN